MYLAWLSHYNNNRLNFAFSSHLNSTKHPIIYLPATQHLQYCLFIGVCPLILQGKINKNLSSLPSQPGYSWIIQINMQLVCLHLGSLRGTAAPACGWAWAWAWGLLKSKLCISLASCALRSFRKLSRFVSLTNACAAGAFPDSWSDNKIKGHINDYVDVIVN
jgi:hypothetical protein